MQFRSLVPLTNSLGGSLMHIDSGTLSIILGVLFGISEALSLIPAVKANSVFQFIFPILQKLNPPAVVASTTSSTSTTNPPSA